MNNLEIQNIENGARFILVQKKVSIFVKLILLIITVITISVPLGVLFFATKIDKLQLLGASVCVFLTFFALRLLLWNAFGKEVFEIDRDKIFHYTDYRFFKDKLFEQNQNASIRFESSNLFSNQKVEEPEVLDLKEDFEKEEFVFIISNNEGELTRSNVKLSQEKVEKMLEVLKQKL